MEEDEFPPLLNNKTEFPPLVKKEKSESDFESDSDSDDANTLLLRLSNLKPSSSKNKSGFGISKQTGKKLRNINYVKPFVVQVSNSYQNMYKPFNCVNSITELFFPEINFILNYHNGMRYNHRFGIVTRKSRNPETPYDVYIERFSTSSRPILQNDNQTWHISCHYQPNGNFLVHFSTKRDKGEKFELSINDGYLVIENSSCLFERMKLNMYSLMADTLEKSDRVRSVNIINYLSWVLYRSTIL